MNEYILHCPSLGIFGNETDVFKLDYVPIIQRPLTSLIQMICLLATRESVTLTFTLVMQNRKMYLEVEGPAKELLAFFSFSQYILFVFFYYFYFYVIFILWFKKSKAMATKQTHSLDTFQIDSHSVLW